MSRPSEEEQDWNMRERMAELAERQVALLERIAAAMERARRREVLEEAAQWFEQSYMFDAEVARYLREMAEKS